MHPSTHSRLPLPLPDPLSRQGSKAHTPATSSSTARCPCTGFPALKRITSSAMWRTRHPFPAATASMYRLEWAYRPLGVSAYPPCPCWLLPLPPAAGSLASSDSVEKAKRALQGGRAGGGRGDRGSSHAGQGDTSKKYQRMTEQRLQPEQLHAGIHKIDQSQLPILVQTSAGRGTGWQEEPKHACVIACMHVRACMQASNRDRHPSTEARLLGNDGTGLSSHASPAEIRVLKGGANAGAGGAACQPYSIYNFR